MEVDTGWIKLHRKLKEHWLWQENRRFSRLEAWLDLITEANHRDSKVVRGVSIIEVKRGQLLTAQIKLARIWKWNSKTVKSFLLLLCEDEMITFEAVSGGDSGYTLITILNYDKYQSKRVDVTGSVANSDGIDEGTSEGERLPTNNKEKNRENEKKVNQSNSISIIKEKKENNKCGDGLLQIEFPEPFTRKNRVDGTLKFCKTMKNRGWCESLDYCKSLYRKLSPKLENKKRIENPVGYFIGTIGNFLNEKADEISVEIKKSRGEIRKSEEMFYEESKK